MFNIFKNKTRWTEESLNKTQTQISNRLISLGYEIPKVGTAIEVCTQISELFQSLGYEYIKMGDAKGYDKALIIITDMENKGLTCQP